MIELCRVLIHNKTINDKANKSSIYFGCYENSSMYGLIDIRYMERTISINFYKVNLITYDVMWMPCALL